jgi:RNA recognition motif-containing protein
MFCFIGLKSAEAQEIAIQKLNGTKFGGQKITVEMPRKKDGGLPGNGDFEKPKGESRERDRSREWRSDRHDGDRRSGGRSDRDVDSAESSDSGEDGKSSDKSKSRPSSRNGSSKREGERRKR